MQFLANEMEVQIRITPWSHFGITSCLDKQHVLSLSYSWKVATVNTVLGISHNKLQLSFTLFWQEAAQTPGEHRVKDCITNSEITSTGAEKAPVPQPHAMVKIL